MLFEPDAVELISILFVALRLGVVLYLTPLDAFGRIPRRIGAMLIFVLAAVLVSFPGIRLEPSSITIIGVGLIAAAELANGLALALGVYAVFSVFSVAGQLIDAQAGFAAAAVLNPATNTQDPLTGLLLQLLAAVLFFAMGMHHIFFEGIVRSFELVPLGGLVDISKWGEIFIGFGLMFSFGVVMAAPVLIGILLLDVGVAAMSRTLPQMNIYFVTLPLRIFCGLVLMALSLRYSVPLVETSFRQIFDIWAAVLSQ